MIYKEWLDIWIEDSVRPVAKQRTYERYKDITLGHIAPLLGQYNLDSLTPSVLQSFVVELLERGNLVSGKGLSSATVNTVITVLQNSLKSARAFGQTKEYFADRIRRPRMEEKQISCFTLAQQRQIEEEITKGKKDKMFGVILCLYTGIRIGELLALEWEDIAFSQGTLSVDKTCHYGKGKDGNFARRVGSPKTKTSCRIIPLPKQILARLKALKKRSKARYVVSNGQSPVSLRSYQKSFALLLQRLKIPHKGFHALRHTFATRALECGMDVKTLAEILGHKNAVITLNRYVHSLMEHKQDMMDKVGKLLQ